MASTTMTATDGMTAVDRLALFCSWFDLTPPKVRKRKGDIIVTDDFIGWVDEHGMSLSWLGKGGTKEEAVAHRKEWLDQRQMREVLAGFDAVELEMLAGALRDHHEGRAASLELVMQGWRDAVIAYRAGRAA